MTRETIRPRVVKSLESLPDPLSAQEPLTALFHQLVGAGYSLLAADAYGALTRSYIQEEKQGDLRHLDEAERCAYIQGGKEREARQLVGILSESNQIPLPPDPGSVWSNWVCGFYFNAARHRVALTFERLIKVCACSPMICCDPPPPTIDHRKTTRLRKLAKECKSRLMHLAEHAEDPKRDTSATTKLADFALEDVQDDERNLLELTDDNYLEAIRWDDQDQKHRYYPHYRLRTDTPAEHSQPKTWVTLDITEQLSRLIDAFQLLCKSYVELHDMLFGPRPVLIPAKNEDS